MHAYGRVLQRMSDVDFKAASLDGVGIDWPFEYADLAPYYDRVEELVGLYGDACMSKEFIILNPTSRTSTP